MTSISHIFAAASLAVLSLPLVPVSAGQGGAPDLTVDHVVLVMRHGVRPPTKDPAMPAGTAIGEWPKWSVNPGWLTPHGAGGAKAVEGVHTVLVSPNGCAVPGQPGLCTPEQFARLIAGK